MAENWDGGINGGRDEDEALRTAIAMSLGREPEKRGGGGGVIDLTQDDDDDDVVVENGNGGRKDGVVPAAVDSTQGSSAIQPKAEQQTAPSSEGFSFSALGLDRKKMEEERLARLKKRKASSSGEDLTRVMQRPKVENISTSASTQPLRQQQNQPQIQQQNQQQQASTPLTTQPPSPPPKKEEKPAAVPQVTTSTPPSTGRLPFPRGAVKKTWAYGHPRQGDDIKIEEVLQKQQLRLAVLSSYQWDENWLLNKVDISRTKLILVAFAANEAQKEEMRSNVPSNRIRFCFPPMYGMGAMHSKLMLLKYDTYMRIVIPTGNLMSYDWGETGTMENMVFLIDLPKLGPGKQFESTSFSRDLNTFLRAQGLEGNLIDSLRNYDFSETAPYHFVHTIAGTHADWCHTGYPAFGHQISSLVRLGNDPIEIDYVCASLGNLKYNFLVSMYYACAGDPQLGYEALTASNKSKRKALFEEAKYKVDEHMRVFFPSRETVVQSKGGEDGAGTICFQRRWWDAKTFPKRVLRDCKSVRPGVLMHSKIMYMRPSDLSIREGRCYAYVGSANLSESAWGIVSGDVETGEPSITCRNWECGVLLRAGDDEYDKKKREEREAKNGPTPENLPTPSSFPAESKPPVQSASNNNNAHQEGYDPYKWFAGGEKLDAFKGYLPVPMEWPSREIIDGQGAGGGRGGGLLAQTLVGAGPDFDRRTPWFFQRG
ncbi:tyrosyl-DNA phosphodiesterase-domain-containing protein [Dichotomopilus funicola]|uniref:Tyrosyl-DNA phosphodiesterase-domain-containing protein n=1 Tax=Dichotomopilus funicola TaxID=1934379 RepID=A0AAN6V8T2_9PEZI|nr:tyrosyl-DNA phosphodiesterase-domain-containing protein [Dichotomopilus funicola]